MEVTRTRVTSLTAKGPPMPTTVRCPSCAEPLSAAGARCPSCALPLTGPIAVRLWQVDQSIAALQAERVDLIGQLRRQVSGDPVASQVANSAGRGRWSGQQVLLGAGVLLLLTAAAVFVAVAWSLIGVAGQVGVMAAATVVAGVTAAWLSRRGLRATAEAAALLTVGLAAVDATAAYRLDLGGLGSVDGAGYCAIVAGLLTVVFAAIGVATPRLRTFPIAAVAAAAVVPVAAVEAAELWASSAGAPAASAVCLLSAVGFASIRAALQHRWPIVRLPLTIAAGGYLGACWLTALPEVFDSALRGTGGWCAAIAILAALGCGTVAGLGQGLLAGLTRPLLAVPAVIAGSMAVVGVAGHASTGVLCAMVVALAALTGALAAGRRSLRTHPVGVLAAVAHLVALGGVVTIAERMDLGAPLPRWLPFVIALTAVAASAAATAALRPFGRPVWAGYAAVAAVVAVAAAAYPFGPATSAVALTCAAVLVTLGAGWRRGRTEEYVLAAAAVAAAGWAGQFASEADAHTVAFVFAGAGLAALAYGILPGRGYVSVLGVLGCSAASWTLLADDGVHQIEAYTLPLAALAGLVGAVRIRRHGSSPTWLTVGPALTAALLPSALVTLDDSGITRPLLLLAVSAAVLVGGIVLRWQAPVVMGAVAIDVVAVSQLAPYAVGLPRWLTLGTVGLMLLAVGARYEQRLHNARDAGRWVRALQ